jgi:hypothetical protein
MSPPVPTVTPGEGRLEVEGRPPVPWSPMSKRTSKMKANVRRKKANHGRKPNMGRNS